MEPASNLSRERLAEDLVPLRFAYPNVNPNSVIAENDLLTYIPTALELFVNVGYIILHKYKTKASGQLRLLW